ncbi:MAG: Crp/Fnr family transcriptional regulator [Anderseniella sp.]|nr:Crp/Fnr family transcriptional regulator [Anderseniella sp.]
MTPDELAAIAVWAGELTQDELAHAASGVRMKTFERGQHVAHFSDRVDAWHGVISGVLRIGHVSDTGQVAGVSAILGGGWFGEGSIIKDEARRYDVAAVTDAEVAIMRGDTFRWLFANSVGFNRFLVQLLNERLGQFIAIVSRDRTSSAVVRLAHTIAAMYNPVLFPRTPRVIEMPQEDLGLFAGISRQITNKSLHALADDGLIQLMPTGLKVLDIEGLKDYGG